MPSRWTPVQVSGFSEDGELYVNRLHKLQGTALD